MHKSRLLWSQQQRLMEHFVAGTTARTAGVLVRVNKTTAAEATARERARTPIPPRSFAFNTLTPQQPWLPRR